MSDAAQPADNPPPVLTDLQKRDLALKAFSDATTNDQRRAAVQQYPILVQLVHDARFFV